MILDASAILAILKEEPEAEAFSELLAVETSELRVSAVNWLEVAIRVDGMGEADTGFEELLEMLNVQVVPVTEQHSRLAREAYRRFGKGRHPARLNMGDCFAYALAKATGEPLLFKGDDFSQTDILPALPPPDG